MNGKHKNKCKIYAKQILLRDFSSSKDFARYNSPIFFANLVSIVQICSSQGMFSSSNTARNFIAAFKIFFI